MATSNLSCASLESISERGLRAFLQAIAGIVPNIDLQDAADCWIRAMESTNWEPAMSADRFIRQVTINALTTGARRQNARSLVAPGKRERAGILGFGQSTVKPEPAPKS